MEPFSICKIIVVLNIAHEMYLRTATHHIKLTVWVYCFPVFREKKILSYSPAFLQM